MDVPHAGQAQTLAHVSKVALSRLGCVARRWVCAGVLGSFFSSGASLGAAPAPDWVWLLSDYAPFALRQGPLAGQGYAQRMLAEVLWPALPQHRHAISWVSSGRLLAELDQQPASCALLLRKTAQRAAQWHYSRALIRHWPVGMVLRRSDLEDGLLQWSSPSDRGEIELARFLAAGRVVGVIGDRVHGALVDELLARHPEQRRKNRLVNANRAMFGMVSRRHGVDATLAYSFELSHYQLTEPPGVGAEALVWMPLAELRESQLGFVACAASPQGQAHVAAVDDLLAQPGVRERLQLLYEAWLAPMERQRLQALRQQMGARFWQE
ncbi:uncharacterized protein (TIGR02285 family) [Inhella inkyongensis]|uniref:Uncharacterized protein (TIGR02285 family) n=1 Tax=Inhella inkyongensis TaxID=392593 RepID=A0A840S5H7_9BURK|nr:hypothetical protein [Inhella inkyongensis]MBB5205645.1 uncharacterized protein (TIGR02285 family) [Inhella inkyongensis]